MPNNIKTPDDIAQMVRLLRTTDLSIAAVGKRMGVHPNKISLVNRQYNCRVYTSHTKWTVPARDDEKVDGGICLD